MGPSDRQDPSLISILMPVYNAAPFLPECLSSITNQSDRHWELLAVNDFSDDLSWEVLQAFAAKDPRIRPLQNDAKGIIPALQKAYRHSKGELITRMDADDRMGPHKLALFREVLAANGPGWLVTGRVKYFSQDGVKDGYRRYEHWLNELASTGRHYQSIYRECVIPSPNWMIYRQDLDRCGAFEPDTYPEDYDLCFRFYQNNLRIAGVQEVTHYWRDHAGRASRNDAHYADNRYLQLKLPYFLELDREAERPLVLWGAGKKGKLLANMLVERNIPFHWVCNTPSKWKKAIYGQVLLPVEALDQHENPQVVVAVASPHDQRQILRFAQARGWTEGRDLFFFS